MAQITTNIDDLTGESLPTDNPTTTIRVNDPRWSVLTDLPASIEIDLSDTSLKALIKALEKFGRKGRSIIDTKATPSRTDDTARQFASDARQWAIATNLQPPVSERGAVPQRALDAYREHLATSPSVTDGIVDVEDLATGDE